MESLRAKTMTRLRSTSPTPEAHKIDWQEDRKAKLRMAATFIVALVLQFGAGAWSPVYGASSDIHSGHSAMWYDPARDGEGWVLEVLSDDRALLYWYTYDEAGNQRWLQAVGNIVQGESGPEIIFPELLVTRGAQFGPSFDPEDVEFQDVGEATMRLKDCDTGTFSYSAFGQSQTIEIRRLSQTMAAGCEPINGVPGQPVKAYAGQSGSWYDLTHDGEGYSLHWLSRDEALLTWYTYDAEGNQYWLIGVGNYQDGQIVFENLLSTRGARFGEAFDPEDVEYIDWGSLVVELQCAVGTSSYESDVPAFGSGEFDLTRLTYLKGLACPWERPKLWDLYDITWTELPIAAGTPMEPNVLHVESVANDGTVVGRLVGDSPTGGDSAVVWRPILQQWDTLPGILAGLQLFIAPDGRSIVGTEAILGLYHSIKPLIWTDGTGWTPLDDLKYDRSFLTARSQDFSRYVGYGHQYQQQRMAMWLWNPEDGQTTLPRLAEDMDSTPSAVSNDGTIVIGTARPHGVLPTLENHVAVKWQTGHNPRLLRDLEGSVLRQATACDADCRLIFGAGQSGSTSGHPSSGEAWFSGETDRFGYLGTLDDVLPGEASYGIAEVSADGTIAVGSYATTNRRITPGRALASRAFIWTQATGLVSIRSIIEELKIGDDAWDTMVGVSISPNGRKVLLAGYFEREPGQAFHNRGVVLSLNPKGE